MKIVHTADTQIKNWPFGGLNPDTGLNRRFEDALGCLDFIIDHAIKIKADFFIHAGDVNEERNPDSISIEKFAERIKKLIDCGIKVIIAVGNHDIDSALGTNTSVSYLKKLGLPNLYIADRETEIFTFDDLGIVFQCFPYFTKAQKGFGNNEELVEYLKEESIKFLSDKRWEEYYRVAVSHYSVDKVFPEWMEINEPILPITMFQEYDYAAFGHIHHYTMYYDEGVTGGYPGSPYRCSFGEKEEKYFNMIDFESGEIDKIRIQNRAFIDIEVDAREADQASIEDFVIHKLAKMELEGKFLKIKIKCYQNFSPRTIYEHLKKRDIFHYQPVIFEKEKVKEEARLNYQPGLSSGEIVSRFLKKQGLNDDFKKKVQIECNDIMKTVKEYETSQC